MSDENIEVAASFKDSERRFKSDIPYELQAEIIQEKDDPILDPMTGFPNDKLGEQKLTVPVEMENDMQLDEFIENEKKANNMIKMSARMSHAAESV